MGVPVIHSTLTNMPQIIQEIVKAVPQIVTSIVGAFGSGVSQMVEVGKNLVKGFMERYSKPSWLDKGKGLFMG